MSNFLDSLIAQVKGTNKTIVLPEGNDPRTLQAAEAIALAGIANLIVLGDDAVLSPWLTSLNNAKLKSTIAIKDSRTDSMLENVAAKIFELREAKGVSQEQALELAKNGLYFGATLVKLGQADGMVAGAVNTTSDVLRSALQIIRTAPTSSTVSSFFIMVLPEQLYGANGVFLYADCGLNQYPPAEQLAAIAVESAKSFTTLIGSNDLAKGQAAKVALLSHSTKGSAKGESVTKVQEAVVLANKLLANENDTLLANCVIDGELQVDAAIVPDIASQKAPDSPLQGHANVLIFPDLDSGNIAYKLTERLANAKAYGPITQGLAAPVNDLSRGCTADDIVGVAAITVLQALSQ